MHVTSCINGIKISKPLYKYSVDIHCSLTYCIVCTQQWYITGLACLHLHMKYNPPERWSMSQIDSHVSVSWWCSWSIFITSKSSRKCGQFSCFSLLYAMFPLAMAKTYLFHQLQPYTNNDRWKLTPLCLQKKCLCFLQLLQWLIVSRACIHTGLPLPLPPLVFIYSPPIVLFVQVRLWP